MHHIGVDIVEISRIRQAAALWGDRFLSRLYTEVELETYIRRPFSLAARFAGKEAVIKALDKTAGISFKQIEILSAPDGKPIVRLHGRAQEQAQSMGLRRLDISISHSRDYAVALVIGETK